MLQVSHFHFSRFFFLKYRLRTRLKKTRNKVLSCVQSFHKLQLTSNDTVLLAYTTIKSAKIENMEPSCSFTSSSLTVCIKKIFSCFRQSVHYKGLFSIYSKFSYLTYLSYLELFLYLAVYPLFLLGHARLFDSRL